MTQYRQPLRLAATYLILIGACLIALYPLVGIVLASSSPSGSRRIRDPGQV